MTSLFFISLDSKCLFYRFQKSLKIYYWLGQTQLGICTLLEANEDSIFKIWHLLNTTPPLPLCQKR